MLTEIIHNLKEEVDKDHDYFIDAYVDQFTFLDTKTPLTFISAEENKNNFKNTIRELVKNKKNIERSTNSVKIIVDNLDGFPNKEICIKELDKASNILISNLNDFFQHHKEIAEENAQNDQSAKENISLPPPAAEELGISAETVKTIFLVGKKLYENNQLEEALSVFLLLSNLNGYSSEVWLALAICHHRAQEYYNAMAAYLVSALLNPNNPRQYLHCCECAISLNDFTHAKEYFHQAEQFLNKENRKNLEKLIQFCKSKIQ